MKVVGTANYYIVKHTGGRRVLNQYYIAEEGDDLLTGAETMIHWGVLDHNFPVVKDDKFYNTIQKE